MWVSKMYEDMGSSIHDLVWKGDLIFKFFWLTGEVHKKKDRGNEISEENLGYQ